jgi:hypothetical protein
MKKETATTKDKKTAKKPTKKATKKTETKPSEETPFEKAMRALWTKYHESHKNGAI